MTRPSFSAASAGLSVWNGRRPGASALSAPGSKREAGAAVLHQHASSRQHDARTEFPIERLDVGDDQARGIRRAHPDGVALRVGRRPPGGLAHVDLAGLLVEEGGREEAIEIDGDAVGIGDDAVAHPEGALGRFHQAVDVLECFGLLHAQAVENAKDDERSQPLRRRRRVIERAGLNRRPRAAHRPRRDIVRGRRA